MKALLSSDDTTHKFLNFIDRGKLTRPSKSAVSVCLESEKVLQRLPKGSGESLQRNSSIHDTVASAVLENTADMGLFSDLFEHQFETAVEDNHVHLLVKSVASFYTRQLIKYSPNV